MTDITIPVPAELTGNTDSAAPQVTTQNIPAEQIANTPQAETPDGNPQAAKPDGDEQKKTNEEKQRARNRERWQQYKQAKEVLPQQLAVLQREVERLNRAVATPDYSGITDPAEELATRTAQKVQEANAREAQGRLDEEQRRVAQDYHGALASAWTETVENARSVMPDFDVVFDAKVPVHERAVRHIVESENAAEIAYYLGKNREEAASLFQAFEHDPYSALIRFGQLQAKVSAAPAKSTSTAPKPASVLAGGQSPPGFDASRASVSDMAAHLKKAGLIR